MTYSLAKEICAGNTNLYDLYDFHLNRYLSTSYLPNMVHLVSESYFSTSLKGKYPKLLYEDPLPSFLFYATQKPNLD